MARATWILLGGDTLLGKEIRDLAEERKLPVHLRLLSAGTAERVLTEEEGELSVMEPLDAESVEDAAVVLLAGAAESNRKAFELVRKAERRPALVDLRGDLEGLPEARLRAPLSETASVPGGPGTVHVVAHAAASALARVLAALHERSPIRHVVATIFEPASERGREGVDELHKQTVSLFSFQKLPKAVFDAQASFNLLPRYGEDAPVSLESVEQRIERHLATLLAPRGIPLPSLRLIQAPVFHGYCQSVWVEFAIRPAAMEVERWCEEAGFDVRRADVEPGSNASAAGMSGVIVGDILEDRSDGRGMWLWLAGDNLRTMAENALLTAGLAARQESAG
jgi:aspartate-semialdehyde dehydrogenase